MGFLPLEIWVAFPGESQLRPNLQYMLGVLVFPQSTSIHQQAIGPHKNLLTIIKRCKLQWHGHVSCSSGLAKTILQGTVKGGRRQGAQRKRQWRTGKMEKTGCKIICGAPTTLPVKGLMMMMMKSNLVTPLVCATGLPVMAPSLLDRDQKN